MHREGRTSGQHKTGSDSRPRGVSEGGERIWEKGQSHSPVQEQQVCLTPSSHCCQHHLQLHNPIPTQQAGNHIGLPGRVWCEAVVATLSPSQLGKGLLESTLSSQEQGGRSPTPGAVRNHHKHPAQARAGSSCVGRLQVCRELRLFVLKHPEITHTRNTSRSPASSLSP